MSNHHATNEKFYFRFGYDNPLASFWCDIYNKEDTDTPIIQIGLNKYNELPVIDEFIETVKTHDVDLTEYKQLLIDDCEEEDKPLTPLQNLIKEMFNWENE